MPSYAQEVKNELTHRPDDERDCLRAEFVAMLNNTRKIDGRFELRTSNAAVARRLIKLGKIFLPQVKPEIAAVRRKKLFKNLVYVVRFMAGEVQNFFAALDTAEIVKRTRFKVAYLRGAFLSGGTVNQPEGAYFLHIVLFTKAEGQFVQRLLEKLEFRPGLYERKKKFVVWLREADSICDFLGMLGAENAVERFEIARNVKEVRIQVNRIVNVETAALNKSIESSQAQIADIKLLMDANYPVNQKMREAMNLRLENPTSTMRELAEKIGMSAPGLLYRYHMINHMANNLRREKLKSSRAAAARSSKSKT